MFECVSDRSMVERWSTNIFNTCFLNEKARSKTTPRFRIIIESMLAKIWFRSTTRKIWAIFLFQNLPLTGKASLCTLIQTLKKGVPKVVQITTNTIYSSVGAGRSPHRQMRRYLSCGEIFVIYISHSEDKNELHQTDIKALCKYSHLNTVNPTPGWRKGLRKILCWLAVLTMFFYRRICDIGLHTFL